MYLKLTYTLLLFFNIVTVMAQELYVFAEPASNMPAHSIAAKINSRFANKPSDNLKQRYIPELMLGLNKQWMVHASTTFSDYYHSNLQWESVKLYTKYRFFSKDDIHRHFRMAAFADAAYTKNPFLYDEINLDGDQSGVQAGIILTQLIHKWAGSISMGVVQSFMRESDKVHHGNDPMLTAFTYSVSAGYLLFPKNYTSYQQTNVNIYTEFIGMQGLCTNSYMIDMAPALQFIFNSNTKLNLGMRFQMAGNMNRIAHQNYFIGLERTFLNVLR